MIDHRQLQALSAVHREGSVTRAARVLGWSQPTVDHHLRNLERLVGAPVLQRSHRGSILTRVGALLHDRGQEILALHERALREARELTRTDKVRLRFGTIPTAAALLLHSIVTRVGEFGIEIDAKLEEVPRLVDQVNRHELDAAIVYSVPGHELPLRADIVVTEVLRDPVLLALPEQHPLASLPSVDRASLLKLAGERWLFAAAWDDPMDAVVIDTFAAAGCALDIAIRTDDFQVMLGMVAAGMAVSIIPKVASGAGHPGVALLPIDDPAFVRSLLLVAPGEGPRRGPSPMVRRLASAVRSALAELENTG
ncbi:MAG: LysR family transcriptional regulator [Leucobacter sp.]